MAQKSKKKATEKQGAAGLGLKSSAPAYVSSFVCAKKNKRASKWGTHRSSNPALSLSPGSHRQPLEDLTLSSVVQEAEPLELPAAGHPRSPPSEGSPVDMPSDLATRSCSSELGLTLLLLAATAVRKSPMRQSAFTADDKDDLTDRFWFCSGFCLVLFLFCATFSGAQRFLPDVELRAHSWWFWGTLWDGC